MHEKSIPQRRLGRSDVRLSILTFGSMRLLPARLETAKAVEMVDWLTERGLNSFHVSSEYQSYLYFCDIYRKVRVREKRLIVKLGEPHFGDDRFDPARFENKIDRYLVDLAAETLDVVQWLYRFDLKQEAARLAGARRDADTVAKTVQKLRASGKIRAVVCYPYTDAMAMENLAMSECDGLALYVNSLELESRRLMEQCRQRGKGVIGIRPLAAGRLAQSPPSTAEAFRYAVADEVVTTTIASLNNMAQAFAAIGALSF